MVDETFFYTPFKTDLNLGLSCLVSGKSFIQNSLSNEACHVPCTFSCISRLVDLRRLRHPGVARYIDAQCDKRRIYIVTEHYYSDFSQLNPPITKQSDFNWLSKCLLGCLQGLVYLESAGIVIGSLSPSSLLIDNNGNVKIANFGTFYASRWGLDVDFPVVDLRYSSPEAFLCSESCVSYRHPSSFDPPCPIDSRSDLWSIALIFTEILHFPLELYSPKIILQSLLKSLNSSYSFFDQIVSQLKPPIQIQLHQSDLLHLCWRVESLDNIFRICLVLDARHRPNLRDVRDQYLDHFNGLQMDSCECSDEASEGEKENLKNHEFLEGYEKALQFLQSRNDPAETYYYWQLAGGGVDLSTTLLRGINGNAYVRPPILRLPVFFTGSHGASQEIWLRGNLPSRLKYCPTIVSLPAERLLKRIALMPTQSLYPLLFTHTYSCLDRDNLVESLELSGIEDCWQPNIISLPLLPKHELSAAHTCNAMVFQPVLVKQADVEYQVMRVCLLRRLLCGMPSTVTRLLLEARFDIPPFLRAEVRSNYISTLP